jgi:hypothetical protein
LARRRGRALNAEDESKADLVVLLGQTVYRQLFRPDENPVGTFIQVKSVVLAPRRNSSQPTSPCTTLSTSNVISRQLNHTACSAPRR